MRMLQEHSSTFYLLSLVALSSVLLAVCLKACQIFVVLSKFTGKRLEPSSAGLEITGSSFLPASTINKLALVNVLSLFFAWGLITWTIFDRFHRTNTIELTNVHVLTQSGKTSFTMEVQNRHGMWEPFAADFCLDSDITPEIKPGVTLLSLVYVEDRHMHCFDARQPNGYILWRDAAHVPILSTFPRQTATSCTDQPATPTAEATEARARQ